MSPENRNLILAMAVSMAILVLWQSFFVEPQMQAEQQAKIQSKELNTDGTPKLDEIESNGQLQVCLLYTSPSPRD